METMICVIDKTCKPQREKPAGAFIYERHVSIQ